MLPIALLSCAHGPSPAIPLGDADGDGYPLDQGDCDDLDPAVHPQADDQDGDGVDGDCDGTDRAAHALGDLDGTTAPEVGRSFGHALAIGDLDGDGDDEVLAGSQEG